MLQSLILLASTLFWPSVPLLQDPVQDGEVVIPEDVVAEEGDYILLKFDESDEGLSLRQFIKICQVYTGRNFTLHDQAAQHGLLDKKILLYGEKRIQRKDFYSFFQTMMKINQFVCVPQGSGDLQVIMITPVNATTSSVVKAGATFVDHEDVEDFADQPGVWVATVVPLRYAQAQGLGTSLRTALSGGAGGAGNDAFMPIQGENALLIQNYGPFVAAAVRLVKRLDIKPDLEQPAFAKIVLQEASAEELAELIKDLLEDTAPTAGGQRNTSRGRSGAEGGFQPAEIETNILAYPRDNSLLVTASVENLERVKDLIAQLDTAIDSPETKFRVYQLENISARDLSDDLRDYLQRTQQAEEQAARSTGQSSAAQARQAEQRVVVVGQEETNSLLITATRTRWAELKGLLDQLDERQPQVLIETALIEVSEDFRRDIGFEYASVNPPSGTAQTGFGFSSVGLSTLVDSDGDGQVDTRIPAATNQGLTAGILDGADFGIPVLLAAAQTSNDTNVLSIPSILVTNNRRASIEAIDEIPVTQQTPVQNVGITETFSEFQEAGIKLEITPSISSKRYLRLDLYVEISTFRGAFSGGTVPPPRITRTLTTTVYLPDGATMWVGGVIRDDLAIDETGIPFLSDIPLLGWIFGRTEDSNVKTTLYFFCTPRILDDFEELQDVSNEGKSNAADVIGLDRLQKVDPEFRFDSPLDVILDADVDGDGEVETGMLDMTSFASPAFVTNGGLVSPEEVGADSSRFEGQELVPSIDGGDVPTGRNLPEERR